MRGVENLLGVIVTESYDVHAILIGNLIRCVLVGEPLTASASVILNITAVQTVGCFRVDLGEVVNVRKLFFDNVIANGTELSRLLGSVFNVGNVLFVRRCCVTILTLVPMVYTVILVGTLKLMLTLILGCEELLA